MIKEKTLIAIAIQRLESIKDMCGDVLKGLDKDVSRIRRSQQTDEETISKLSKDLDSLTIELETIEEQRVKQIVAHPEREASINRIYDGLYEQAEQKISKTTEKIAQLKNMSIESVEAQKKAKTAIETISRVIESGEITRIDVESLFENIIVYEDGTVEVELRPDVGIAEFEEHTIVEVSRNQNPREYSVVDCPVNVVREGDPLETTFTERLAFINGIHAMARGMCKK